MSSPPPPFVTAASPSSPATPSAAPSPSKAASSYAFEELHRLSRAVSQPGSLSSFQQLRRSLGDDAAFVVMDYFIDVRTLHDQCVELKAYGADRHAALLRALLLRSELAEPFSIVRGRDEARATQLMAARRVPFADILAHVADLRWALQWAAETAGVYFDCLSHAMYADPRVRFGAAPPQYEKVVFNGDLRPLSLFVVLGRKKMNQPPPLPSNALKLALFSTVAHAYYHAWQVPHSVRRLIDLTELFDAVAFMPAPLRQSMAQHDRQLLLEAGLC